MKCGKCAGIIEEIVDLQMNDNLDCNYCKKMKGEIEKCQVLACESYEEIITNEISSITPLFYNGHILIVNMQLCELEEYRAENCLKVLCQTLDMCDSNIIIKEEKYIFLNRLLGKIYDEFYELIRNQEERALISLLSALEFNRFLMIGIIFWLRYGDISTRKHPLLDGMVQTLENYKTMSGYTHVSTIKYEDIYFQFESILAMDKHAFEYGIEALEYKRSKKCGYECTNAQFDMKRAIQLLRALALVNYYKVETTEGRLKNCNFRIDKEGEIKFDNENISYSDKYVSEMQETFKSDINEKYEQEINRILNNKKGFDIGLIKKLLIAIESSNILGDEYLVGDEYSWVQVIMNSCDCAYEVANKIFYDFVYVVDEEKLFSANSRMENRALRKCFFKYKDCYITVVGLLSFALVNWISEIYTRENIEVDLKKALQKIYNEMDIDFEESVYVYLKENLHIETIKWDVNAIAGVNLPGQIDVLLYINKKIFVVECKNFGIKTHPKVSANEYHQFMRKSKKSFQDKLNEKVLEISRNREKVLEFLGVEADGSDIDEVVGVFVVREFTTATMVKNEGYDVVTVKSVCEWIKNRAFRQE